MYQIARNNRWIYNLLDGILNILSWLTIFYKHIMDIVVVNIAKENYVIHYVIFFFEFESIKLTSLTKH